MSSALLSNDIFCHLAAALSVLLILCQCLYWRQYASSRPGIKSLERGRFVPAAAWLRALSLFLSFYLFGIASGAVEAALSRSAISSEELASQYWWAWFIGMTLFMLIAYWGIWARNTLHFGRALAPVSQTLFGLLWGIAFGLLFLSIWHVADAILLALLGEAKATWQVYILAYVIISLWQALMMDLYWDVYVSPEHDTPASIKLKVPTTHIPNVTLSLIFFAIYQNYAVFIAWQCIALIGCSLAMRMPAPWSKADTPAPMRERSAVFGLPRASGYRE